ncbi:MAG: M56 family metallopeptidase, partial [Longimicrobiales bacterium]
ASDDERTLVVAHERAHQLSRDHLLLAFGCVALVILPWHPVVWWMTRRLRLAVELDCDARVLRAGAQPLRYGSLLVDMAAHRTALPFGAVALAASPTHLERRLLAMTNPAPRRRLARNTVSACLAGALLVAACEADLPTGAEIDEMDVDAIEDATGRIPLTAGEPVYIIDGVESDAAAAHALEPEAIARVNVLKGSAAGEGHRPTIDIVTQAALERMAATRARSDDAGVEHRAVILRPLMKVDEPTAPAEPDGLFNGLLLIDGRPADPSVLRTLSPETIERVDVLKGDAAMRLFPDPAAQNGVIQIYTKAGSGGR